MGTAAAAAEAVAGEAAAAAAAAAAVVVERQSAPWQRQRVMAAAAAVAATAAAAAAVSGGSRVCADAPGSALAGRHKKQRAAGQNNVLLSVYGDSAEAVRQHFTLALMKIEDSSSGRCSRSHSRLPVVGRQSFLLVSPVTGIPQTVVH